MLSLSQMSGSGQGEYYLGLAAEDYYLRGGEPLGVYWGGGAKALGLTGTVKDDEFRCLLRGFSPEGEKLVRSAGTEKHRVGWDGTFSAPKSVSVAWAMADRTTRRQIEEAHRAAVKAGLSYLQDEAGWTRLGKGGHELVKCGLTVAMFEHGTSRAQDPQLHTHCLILNIATTTENGKTVTRTLEAAPLYHHKMAAGALYRAELAMQLEQRLAWELEKEQSWFHVRGVPRTLCTELSKERRAIEKYLAERGLSGAVASAFAALSVREKKGHVAREKLFAGWQEIGQKYGFSKEEVRDLSRGAQARVLEVQKKKALTQAIDEVTKDQTHFSEKQLQRRVAEAAQTLGIGAKEARVVVADYLKTRDVSHTTKDFNRQAIYLGRDAKGELRYTTREIRDTERAMLDQVKASHASGPSHVVRTFTLRGVLLEHNVLSNVPLTGKRSLNDEQAGALEHVTRKSGSIAVISGRAGSGKTTLLQAVRETYEKDGYNVIGCALSGKAARGLEEGSGIRSRTIHSLLWELDRAEKRAAEKSKFFLEDTKYKLLAIWKYATWQIDAKTAKKLSGEYFEPTSKVRHEWWYATHQISKAHKNYLDKELERRDGRGGPLELTKNTILVVDEAGMCGTKHMSRLIEATERAGAKLVLVGDSGQLQPIEAGAPFERISKITGQAELKKNQRQHAKWQVEALEKFREGRAAEALAAYADHGALRVSDTRNDAKRDLIRSWKENGGTQLPKDHLILAGERAEVRELNRMAHTEMRVSGKLSGPSVTVAGNELQRGDRILFTKNSKEYSVCNGDFGTIESVNPTTRHIVVRLDDRDRLVMVPTYRYESIDYGYSATVHKAQGATVKNAYILLGGSMQDAELTYVEGSRAREHTRFFADRREAGDDLAAWTLSAEMSRSRKKELAHDILIRNRPPQETEPSIERQR